MAEKSGEMPGRAWDYQLSRRQFGGLIAAACMAPVVAGCQDAESRPSPQVETVPPRPSEQLSSEELFDVTQYGIGAVAQMIDDAGRIYSTKDYLEFAQRSRNNDIRDVSIRTVGVGLGESYIAIIVNSVAQGGCAAGHTCDPDLGMTIYVPGEYPGDVNLTAEKVREFLYGEGAFLVEVRCGTDSVEISKEGKVTLGEGMADLSPTDVLRDCLYRW